MKKNKLFPTLLICASFFLASCGSDEKKPDTTVTATTITDTTQTVTTVPTSAQHWDEVLDQYDKYVDDYATTYRKAMSGDEDAKAAVAGIVKKGQELQISLAGAKKDRSFTPAQYKRLTEIQQRMMRAIQGK
jgi:hypothetical protein